MQSDGGGYAGIAPPWESGWIVRAPSGRFVFFVSPISENKLPLTARICYD